MMELVNETQMAVAQLTAFGIANRSQILAHQGDFATTRRIEATEQMQQRTFTRSRSANDRHTFARCHGKVDAAQHRHLIGRASAFTEYFTQSAAGQHDVLNLTHNAAPLPD